MSDKEEIRGDAEVRIFIITNNDEAARLIGSGGETVTNLRHEFTGIKLRIGNKVPGVDEQVTEVAGPIERVTELLMRIAEITIEPRSSDDPLLTLLVHNAGGLIGTGGQRVTRIRKESGASIKIAKDNLAYSSQTPVTVSGTLESLEKACKMILEFVSECEPVDVVYSPEMSSDRRGGRDSGRGGRSRRGSRREDRWGGGRSSRGYGGGRMDDRRGRDGGRRGGGGWGERDRGSRSRGGGWGGRDDGPRSGGWRSSSAGDWGGPRKEMWPRTSPGRGDYDPYEPSASRRGTWGGRDEPPRNGWGGGGGGGWDRPEARPNNGWQSSNVERGWGKSSERERGWGPSRSAGGGGWGPPERSRREYGGRRGPGGW